MENVGERAPYKAWAVNSAKVIGGVAAVAFVFDKLGVIETLTREPIDIYPYLNNECEPTSEVELEAVREILEIAAEDTSNDGYELIHPEDYGLTPLDSEVIREINTIEDPAEAIDYVNKLTTELYGFPTTTEKPSDQQTLTDSQDLVKSLSKFPIEIVNAGAINELRLNADITEDHAATYESLAENINLGPGSARSFGHELGHAFAKKWSYKNCEHPTVNTDPNFEEVNPEGFEYDESYDGDSELIEDATITSYGGTAIEEDFATFFDELTASRDNGLACPYYDQPDIVNEKFTIIISRLEEAAPGAGEYYSMDLTSRRCSDEILDFSD